MNLRAASRTRTPSSRSASIQRYNDLKGKIVDQRSKISDDSDKLRTRLTHQFSVSDAQIARFKSTLSFLQNQIAAWNKSG